MQRGMNAREFHTVVLCKLSTLAWRQHVCQCVTYTSSAIKRRPHGPNASLSLRTAKLWKAKNVPKYEAATAIRISSAFA